MIGTLINKLRFIYVPYLLISIGFIVAYSFLDWLISIRIWPSSINEELTNFWLPFALAWLPVLIWLRPRIRALKFTKAKSPYAFELVAALTMGICTIVTQNYLESATGKLTKLDRVSDIRSAPSTKYYVIEDFFADKRHAGMETSVGYGARTNNPDRFSAFFAAPMRDSAFVFPYRKSDIWLGIKYTDSIENRHDRVAMEEEYRRFVQSAISRFNGENLESFSYFERVGNNEDRRSIEAAIDKSDVYDSSMPQVVLIGQYEAFESRNGAKLAWAFGVFGAGSAIWFLMLLFPRLNDEELRRIQRGRPSRDKDLKEALDFFCPRLGFCVTPIIIGVNILVFVAMALAGLGVASFHSGDLVNWGANYSPLVRQGQWFRLFTSMFIHGGLFHLAMNIYGLLFAGLFLESMLGTGKFAFAYLFTGITASIVSILVHPNTVSLGASGAIFGLYGVLLVLLFVKDFGRALLKDPLLINIVIFIGVNLLIGSVAIGIDNAAHVGGLLSGILLGAFFSFAVSDIGVHRSFITRSKQARAKTSTPRR